MFERNVPTVKVVKRLRLTCGLVRRIRKLSQMDSDGAYTRRVHRSRFLKLQQRARDIIRELL